MPTRIRLFGDIQRADQYRFTAYNRHLADALKLRSFRNLAIYRHMVRIPDGGMIDIVCHHDDNEICIHVPPRPHPEQKQPEHKGGANLLIMLGDDFAGYHFFLWDAYGNAQVGPIRTADTLEEIYLQFPPAMNQDDAYIYGTQAGVAQGDFYRYEGTYFTQKLFGDVAWSGDYTDSFTRTYEHPVEGTISCEAKIEQNEYFTSEEVEFDGPQRFEGCKEHMLSLEQKFCDSASPYVIRYAHRLIDRNTGIFVGKMPPTILVKNIPVFEGDHYSASATKIAETTHRDYRILDAINWTSYVPHKFRDIAEIAHSWTCPLGNLNLIRRNPHSEVDANKPWHFSYWDAAMTPQPQDSESVYLVTTIRISTERDEASRLFYPNIEKKYPSGFPDTSDGNPIGNRTIEFRCWREKELMFQIYSVSLVEWAGKPVSDGSANYEELYKADCTWIAAGCGRMTNEDDPAQQERSPEFEAAIAKLIDQAVLDQFQSGKINEHRHYRGYIHGYFFDLGIQDIFDYPRSRDAERLKLLKLVNEARANNGLDPVKMNWDLEKAGIRFTFDMIDDFHIGHTGQDGSTPVQRHEEAGLSINADVHTTEMENNNELPYVGGENTGYGPSYTAEEMFDLWMNSTDHKANILDTHWNYGMMGADCRDALDGNTYWAQEFAFNPNY